MSIRIVLVDDHEVVRQGLASLLEKQADMQVVGQAGDGGAAIRLADELDPDVMLLDVGMGPVGGIQAAEQLRQHHPDIAVIALSIHDDKRFVSGMLDAGASGYLTKDCAMAEVVEAVRCVAGGRSYLSKSVAGAVVDAYRNRRNTGPTNQPQLSPRERDVVKLIAEGLTTKQIAQQLHLSPRTVETHRRNIMEKLSMRGVADLTRYAIREGLVALS